MAKGGVKETCTVDGCGRARVGWGLCGLHYARKKRSGVTMASHRSQARAETIGPDGKRKCWKCGERKPFDLAHFYEDHRHPGELKGTCIACCRRAVRAANVSRLYDITQAEYEALLRRQKDSCAICRQPFDHTGKQSKVVMSPHVDHDHETNAVRGLLCHHCNVLLGHAQDSTSMLRSAIDYLEASSANA